MNYYLAVPGVMVRAFFTQTVPHAESQIEKYQAAQDRFFESNLDRLLKLDYKQGTSESNNE